VGGGWNGKVMIKRKVNSINNQAKKNKFDQQGGEIDVFNVQWKETEMIK